MRTKRSSRHFAALSASLALVGGVVAVDAQGVAPQPTATCAIGGESTITFTGYPREGVQMGWADADRINFSQIALTPDARVRSISLPTPEGARFLAVFIAYDSGRPTHGGNINLEVECT